MDTSLTWCESCELEEATVVVTLPEAQPFFVCRRCAYLAVFDEGNKIENLMRIL